MGIQAVAPSPAAQKLAMSLIYDDVKAGRDGDPQKFAAIHEDLLAQGCDCGVLACTELSVFADKHHLPPYYTDAMAVLELFLWILPPSPSTPGTRRARPT